MKRVWWRNYLQNWGRIWGFSSGGHSARDHWKTVELLGLERALCCERQSSTQDTWDSDMPCPEAWWFCLCPALNCVWVLVDEWALLEGQKLWSLVTLTLGGGPGQYKLIFISGISGVLPANFASPSVAGAELEWMLGMERGFGTCSLSCNTLQLLGDSVALSLART